MLELTVPKELYTEVTIRLLVAVLAGALIGLERSFHGRPAGFRTHTLVCTASSLLMLLTAFQWDLLADVPMETVRVDPTRMAQGIMTGIGFLGAGVIMKERMTVSGLTTAASIWITAATGIMLGMGFYFAGLMAAVLTLAILSVLRHLETLMPSMKFARLSIHFQGAFLPDEDTLRTWLKELGFSGSRISIDSSLEKDRVTYQLTIRTLRESNYDRLAQDLRAWKGLVSYSVMAIRT